MSTPRPRPMQHRAPVKDETYIAPACDRELDGDGACDGYDDDGEHCNCPCHYAIDWKNPIDGYPTPLQVELWHQSYYNDGEIC